MNVYLVQHGKAKAKEDDPERPLTDDGMEEVRKIAGFIGKKSGNQPDSVYHSGKTRALETAQMMADSFSPSSEVIEVDGLKPLDDPSVWADRIEKIDDEIMLVGHLPHMSKLAALLIS